MSRKRRTVHYKKTRRGASLVEFALVAPIFFLFVFGMVELGRMVMVQQLLTNASREGARQAVLDGATSEHVQDVVEQYLANASIDVQREKITVTPDPPATAFGDPITVSVSTPYSDVSWLPFPRYLNTVHLEASTQMRRETAQ
jgi:Flp pilus assembly protein TadG